MNCPILDNISANCTILEKKTTILEKKKPLILLCLFSLSCQHPICKYIMDIRFTLN